MTTINIDRRKLIEAATAKALREAEEAFKAKKLAKQSPVGNVAKPCGCKDKMKNLQKEEIDPVPTPRQSKSPLSTLPPEERAKRQYERMTGRKWSDKQGGDTL